MSTEVSYQSGLGRIGESIKGILVGIVFCLAAPIGIWLNEKNAVDNAAALAEMQGKVVEAQADTKDLAGDAKLVHVTGKATTSDTVKDDLFGVSQVAIKLERHVEMYQWDEHEKSESHDNVGGGKTTTKTWTYEKKWADHHIDSGHFHDSGHDNPEMSPKGESWYAGEVKLGSFKLNKELIDDIDVEKTLVITEEMYKGFPADQQAKFKRGSDGKVASGPGTNIGDMRIEFKVVEPQDVSVIATSQNGNFQAYHAANGKERQFLQTGTVSAAEMFQHAASMDNMLLWILRGVLFLVMWIGIGLILGPISAVARAIPVLGYFFGGFVEAGIGFATFLVAGFVTLLITAVVWIAVRPMLGIGMMVGAIALIVLARSMHKPKTA